jgi:cold shock CspA family protein
MRRQLVVRRVDGQEAAGGMALTHPHRSPRAAQRPRRPPAQALRRGRNPDLRDLFVHHSAITDSGFKSLAEGAKVEYEEQQGPKGLDAANVRTI